MSGFLNSLKGMFWFRSPKDLNQDKKENLAEEADIFYACDDASNYAERIKALSSFFEDRFEEPDIEINDVSVMEPYIDLNIEVITMEGKFRLVYYENDELVLRGDPEVVEEIKDPISKRLDLSLKRV